MNEHTTVPMLVSNIIKIMETSMFEEMSDFMTRVGNTYDDPGASHSTSK